MNNTDILVNKNKLVRFIFELKLKIDKSIKDGLITDSDDCLRFIKKELLIVNYDIFTFEGYIVLDNLANQIFHLYYSNDNIKNPLGVYVNTLSKLN
jgi:hypothetical protein